MEFKWFSVTSTISCPVLQLMIWYLNPVVIRSYSCVSQCVCACERKRVREREYTTCIYAHTHTNTHTQHINTHTCICICICVEVLLSENGISLVEPEWFTILGNKYAPCP